MLHRQLRRGVFRRGDDMRTLAIAGGRKHFEPIILAGARDMGERDLVAEATFTQRQGAESPVARAENGSVSRDHVDMPKGSIHRCRNAVRVADGQDHHDGGSHTAGLLPIGELTTIGTPAKQGAVGGDGIRIIFSGKNGGDELTRHRSTGGNGDGDAGTSWIPITQLTAGIGTPGEDETI